MLGHACSVECRGPACEDAYPEGRVDILGDLPFDGQLVLVDDVARGAIVGSVVSGSSFSVAPIPDGIVVGQPEARSVRRFAVPEGEVVEDTFEALWLSLDDRFGASVAVLPDPDGIRWTLVVAAPGADRDRGVIRVYRDAHNGVTDTAITLRGASQGDLFGERMRLCPDRTGDGLPELLVAAPWMQPHPDLTTELPALAGVVMLIDSDALAVAPAVGEVRPALDVASAAWWGADVGHNLGVGLDCRTDFDGDGRFDILLGAPQADGSAGRLYLLASSDGFESGPVEERQRLRIDGDDTDALGTSIASFQREEGPQVLVGLPGSEAGAGGALWLDGRDVVTANRLRERSRFEYERTVADHYGRTVAVAELDGDGLPDLLIGGPDRRFGALYDVGQITVFLGRRVLASVVSSAEADLTITDEQGFRRVGLSIVAHDLDGDGRQELLLPTRSPRSR